MPQMVMQLLFIAAGHPLVFVLMNTDATQLLGPAFGICLVVVETASVGKHQWGGAQDHCR